MAKVERREAQRPTSLGARGWRHQLREVGTLIPPQRVPRKHSGAYRRSIPLATVRGVPPNLGRNGAARTRNRALSFPGARLRANPESRCDEVVCYLWIPGSRLKKARPRMTGATRCTAASYLIIPQRDPFKAK